MTPSRRSIQPPASLEMFSWTLRSEMMLAAFTSRGSTRLAVSLPWDPSWWGGKVTCNGMLLKNKTLRSKVRVSSCTQEGALGQ